MVQAQHRAGAGAGRVLRIAARGVGYGCAHRWGCRERENADTRRGYSFLGVAFTAVWLAPSYAFVHAPVVRASTPGIRLAESLEKVVAAPVSGRTAFCPLCTQCARRLTRRRVEGLKQLFSRSAGRSGLPILQ